MEINPPFTRVWPADVEDLVSYSEKKLWKPHYPVDLVRRFLTELISSRDLIIDLHDGQGRAAAAVLLDNVNNQANDACLEILGIRDSSAVVLPELVRIVREISPPRRTGFQIAVDGSATEAVAILVRLGLAKYYDTYEMRSDCSNAKFEVRNEIRSATSADADEVYAILCEAFAKSPDTSIADFQLWRPRFLKANFYLWVEKNAIAGFANLVEDPDQKEAELRTLGVLERFRGRGIGRHLVHHCLAESQRLGYGVCRLTVAVTNESALELYLKAGFKTFGKLICFRSDFR